MRAGELFDLSGRTALVTGGGRGLGRQLALGLAEAGADVIAAGREPGPCRETADAAAALGRRAWALRADVSRPDSIDALVAEALAAAGRIDVLVNNAGRVWAAPLLEHPLEGWDRVFDLNVRGLFWLSRRARSRATWWRTGAEASST
jgi:gluconate 5-dehydrogenase